MPLVGFRPTKARLIIEDNKASVLVMKVVVYPGDSVKLATGDRLEELTGVLRIRSKDNGARNGARDLGSLVYIAESDLAADPAPAKYQINIAIAGAKFDTLVRVALSGRLPTKFFVDAGERISRAELPGLGYEVRAGKRTKFWNTLAHRTLLVTNFSFILPIDVPEPRGDGAGPRPRRPKPTPDRPLRPTRRSRSSSTTCWSFMARRNIRCSRSCAFSGCLPLRRWSSDSCCSSERSGASRSGTVRALNGSGESRR